MKEAERIYLDNAATTFPKPESVYKALDYANRNLAFNAGRGHYAAAQKVSDVINETKVKLAELIHAQPSRISFESSATAFFFNTIAERAGRYSLSQPFPSRASRGSNVVKCFII